MAQQESKKNWQKLVERLDKAFTTYGMEISAEKTKLTTNNTSGINKIKVNGQNRGTITNFKYLGSVVSVEGSKPVILSLQNSTDDSSIDKVEPSLE